MQILAQTHATLNGIDSRLVLVRVERVGYFSYCAFVKKIHAETVFEMQIEIRHKFWEELADIFVVASSVAIAVIINHSVYYVIFHACNRKEMRLTVRYAL